MLNDSMVNATVHIQGDLLFTANPPNVRPAPAEITGDTGEHDSFSLNYFSSSHFGMELETVNSCYRG